MSKIVLDDIASGYNLSKINSNFQKIEDALNNEVLFRDSPVGEDNSIQSDIDFNGKKLYNLPSPTLPSQPATKEFVENISGLSVLNSVQEFYNLTETAKNEAESARDTALAAYDNFDDRYLGVKTSNPTVDNDGNPLIAGTLYFNSITEVMMLYTGSTWVAAYVSGVGFLASSNNLNDLTNVTSARANLGLGSSATHAATDFSTEVQITASATKSTPVEDDTVGVVDSEDSGKLKKLSFANLRTWVKSFCLPFTGGQMSGPLKGSLGTAIASASTIDLSARAGGDVLHITGTVAIGTVTLGAGDVVIAIADAALPITAGANLLIDGVASGATYTCAANDRIVFIGDSSSKVHVQIIPYAGGTRVLVSAAAATTSGTSVDITGVPSWASVIHIPIDAISTNGSSNVQVQVGSGGSVQTTGYSSQAQYVGSSGSLSSSSTTGFVISDANATDVRRGVMALTKVSGNTWVSSHTVGVIGASTGSSSGGGDVSLSGSLDRIRMTTVNGTDLFDNGQFNFIAMG